MGVNDFCSPRPKVLEFRERKYPTKPIYLKYWPGSYPVGRERVMDKYTLPNECGSHPADDSHLLKERFKDCEACQCERNEQDFKTCVYCGRVVCTDCMDGKECKACAEKIDGAFATINGALF